MHESVHRSPWPTLEELAGIPAPTSEDTYPAALAVIEAVRKAKAEANLSIKAPVKHVLAKGKPASLEALRAVIDDVTRMLSIEELELAEEAPETGLLTVNVLLEN